MLTLELELACYFVWLHFTRMLKFPLMPLATDY